MSKRRKRPKLPELYGTAELARALGCTIQNIDRQAGVPEPIVEKGTGPGQLAATRLWLADDIREFVIERDKQREERRKGRRDEEGEGHGEADGEAA